MQVPFLYPSVPDIQKLEHELKTFSVRLESLPKSALLSILCSSPSLPQTSGTNFTTQACLQPPLPLRANRSYLAWPHPCVHISPPLKSLSAAKRLFPLLAPFYTRLAPISHPIALFEIPPPAALITSPSNQQPASLPLDTRWSNPELPHLLRVATLLFYSK